MSVYPVSIDLTLALDGYLNGPDGGLRFIYGLDMVAADAVLYGVTLAWDQDVMRGRCETTSGCATVQPWAYELPPREVLEVLTHEIAHHVTGHDEAAAAAWQEHFYGGAIEPLVVV